MSINVEQLSKALLITEKIEALKGNQIKSELNTEKIIQDWISLKSLVSEENFKQRLHFENINENDFARAIESINNEEHAALIEFVKKSDWFSLFKEMVVNFKEMDENAQSREDFTIDESFIVRLYSYYFGKLFHERIKNITRFEISETIIIKLLESLATKLYTLYSKVLITELQSYKASFELEGEEGKEKFIYFLRKNFLKEEDLLEFYYRYPVLTRNAIVLTKNSIDFFVEALTHLNKEYDQLISIYHQNLHILSDIAVSAGDTHEKGKTVLIFEFDNNVKVIYKPRDLRIVLAYNDFLKWINQNSGLLEMESTKGIYRENYALEKFIKDNECLSEKEVINYYQRFGVDHQIKCT